MAEEQQTVPGPLVIIFPLVPGMTDHLDEGTSLLDLGCGSGRAIILMAARFRTARFMGYDLSGDALRTRRARRRELGLDNARFEAARPDHLGVDAEPQAFARSRLSTRCTTRRARA